MSANLVNLNTNPCKMCMPMGSVSAFYGISKSMSILHGSQGCSTYIRRHMATHYNEPVDIASSSLTEEGTVFGGTKNLLKGLENLIKLYNPEVIGVSTTCLAETIGEDVPAIIKQFKDAHPEVTATIIPVASPGYAGSQYEGFFRALHAIVRLLLGLGRWFRLRRRFGSRLRLLTLRRLFRDRNRLRLGRLFLRLTFRRSIGCDIGGIVHLVCRLTFGRILGDPQRLMQEAHIDLDLIATLTRLGTSIGRGRLRAGCGRGRCCRRRLGLCGFRFHALCKCPPPTTHPAARSILRPGLSRFVPESVGLCPLALHK